MYRTLSLCLLLSMSTCGSLLADDKSDNTDAATTSEQLVTDQSFLGRVVSVTEKGFSITDKELAVFSFFVDDATTITRNGLPATLAKLKKGDKVNVVAEMTDDNRNRAKTVVATGRRVLR